MHIELEWFDDDQTILYYHFRQGWQWGELQQAFEQAYTMIARVDHAVDIIMDFSDGWNIPQGAVSQARRAFNEETHPQIKLTVIVGNQFVKSLADLVKKFIGRASENWPMEIALSRDEAVTIIAAHRESRLNK